MIVMMMVCPQSAAGIFQHLKGIVHSAVQQEPTPDLQPDTLTALSSLCVAQAQEVIAVKAINGMLCGWWCCVLSVYLFIFLWIGSCISNNHDTRK